MAKEYTLEQQLAYYKKKAAGKGGSRKSAPRTKKKRDVKRKKRSGCTYEESYKGANGETVHRPKIWGWRISQQHGFQRFTAYLSKDDGRPQSGEHKDECLVFVVNLVTDGVGEQTLSAVWSKKYRKLSITKLGLVANPFANDGGYFGRGGSRYKNKIK